MEENVKAPENCPGSRKALNMKIQSANEMFKNCAKERESILTEGRETQMAGSLENVLTVVVPRAWDWKSR